MILDEEKIIANISKIILKFISRETDTRSFSVLHISIFEMNMISVGRETSGQNYIDKE